MLECYADLPEKEAALAFGEDYELARRARACPPPTAGSARVMRREETPRCLLRICLIDGLR